jgi:hypothetical protein
VVGGLSNFVWTNSMDGLKPVAWMVSVDGICILLTQRELAARQWAEQGGNMFPLYAGEEIEVKHDSQDIPENA